MEQTQEQEQQNYPHVIPCYDVLIDFLKSWFTKTAPVFQRPILEISRYSGNSNKLQQVVKWTVASDAKGVLKELSLVCDSYATLGVRVQVAGVVKDFSLQTALTLPYQDLELLSDAVVCVWCKSDGVAAINFDASIVGKELLK